MTDNPIILVEAYKCCYLLTILFFSIICLIIISVINVGLQTNSDFFIKTIAEWEDDFINDIKFVSSSTNCEFDYKELALYTYLGSYMVIIKISQINNIHKRVANVKIIMKLEKAIVFQEDQEEAVVQEMEFN